MDKAFSELVLASQGEQPSPHFIHADRMKLALADVDGQLVFASGKTELAHRKTAESLVDFMRQIGASEDRAEHISFGAAMKEPIRMLARYKAWTQEFFGDFPVKMGDDIRIPTHSPIGKAFYSSPEGRPYLIRVGMTPYVRPTLLEVQTGIEIGWQTLQTAGWAILQRVMEESADDMSRKVDNGGKVYLQAAVDATAGHKITVSGGIMTKAAIDSVIVTSASIGFPITHAAINPARLMDMTNWVTNPYAYFHEPLARNEAVFRNLFTDGYAGIRWFVSLNVPQNEIWLGGDPNQIGYHLHYGQAQSASDVDVMRRVDQHVVWQSDGYFVANAYNVWEIIITA